MTDALKEGLGEGQSVTVAGMSAGLGILHRDPVPKLPRVHYRDVAAMIFNVMVPNDVNRQSWRGDRSHPASAVLLQNELNVRNLYKVVKRGNIAMSLNVHPGGKDLESKRGRSLGQTL